MERIIATPLGKMRAREEDGYLTELLFTDTAARAGGDDTPLLKRVQDQLAEYFTGTRTAFDLPLRLKGTPFMKAVWAVLMDVPCGQTTSYGLLAARAGFPRAARAVGGAVGRNPIALVVPCHRVIGAQGAIVGYAGGVERKRALLALERECNSR